MNEEFEKTYIELTKSAQLAKERIDLSVEAGAFKLGTRAKKRIDELLKYKERFSNLSNNAGIEIMNILIEYLNSYRRM